MKTRIFVATAILALGLGPAFAGTPSTQATGTVAQQQERPLGESPAYKNQLYPAPEGGAMAQQQERPLGEPPADKNQLYPAPEGGAAAQQQVIPMDKYEAPKAEGGAAAVAPEQDTGSQK